MVETYSCINQNSAEISPGKLFRGVPCSLIRVDIFAMSDKRYRTSVCGSVKKIMHETFLPRLFFGKSKTLHLVVQTKSTFSVNKSGMDV